MSRNLLHSLVIEVSQAERSGSLHPRVEAQRLEGTAAGRAMADIADDCAQSLAELRTVAEHEGLLSGRFGERLGGAFSAVRRRVVDLLMTREESYRATLLGVRHGVDAIQLLLTNAEFEKDIELVEWCMRTLDRRRPLVEKAQHELTWFGHNPDLAIEPAKQTLLGKAARALAGGLRVLRLGGRD